MKSLIKIVRTSRRRTPATVDVAPPATVAEAPVQAADFVGYFDDVGAGRIQGWAASRADLDASLKVRLYLDDRLCAEGVAANHRADVEAAGYGNGKHAFDLPVPKKALICAGRLTLAAVADDGSEVVCCEKRLREESAPRSPVLYLDASDLIEFLTHHRELSGIQRVQAGYLLGLGNTTIAGATCRICTRFKVSSFYFDVPYAGFAALMRQAGDAALVSKSAWSTHVRAFKEGLVTRAEFRAGDTIFTMGAPWALDDHNETIRCLKQHDGARYLQIFYDLIPISVPEVVAAPLIPHFARSMAAMSLYADHIFAISRYARDDLADTLKRLGRSVPETGVIPMGGTITDAEDAASAPASGTLQRLGVTGPFVLCVGTLEPRKNHMLLFQVWRRLVAKHGADAVPLLVLVGRVGWYMEDFLRQLKITGFVSKTVIHLMGVSNAELSDLYDGSLFTVFPSFSEGWGLPITESLARGKVCVCSNVTSMPEAGGAHALYIDPYDTTEAFDLCERLIYEDGFLKQQEARLRDFKAPTWAEASEGLRTRFADLLPRLAAQAKTASRAPIEIGRTYKFYNIEAASPNALATEVFRNFLDQEEALDLLVGWHWFELDVSCTWSCGDEAALCIPVPESAGPLDAYIGLVVPPACDDRVLEVAVDGVVQGACRVRTGSPVMTVPLLGTAHEHRVTLRLSGRRPESTETRLLGLGVSTVVVHRRDTAANRVKLVHAGRSGELVVL